MKKKKTNENNARVGECAKIEFKQTPMSFVGVIEHVRKSDVYVRPQGCNTLVVVTKREATFTAVS